MSSDTYYVNRCLDGHPDDFRHLVGRYQRVLVAHLVGRLGRLDAAAEAAQPRAETRGYDYPLALVIAERWRCWSRSSMRRRI